jgi:hypothetical protein
VTFVAGRAPRRRRWLVALAAVAILGVSWPVVGRMSGVAADTGDVGFEDGSTAPAGEAATGEKPESKIWFNDGSWWGSLIDPVTGAYYIDRLDTATQTWVRTATPLDDRPDTRADTLWTGAKLYVASHVYSRQPAPGFPTRLYRFSYDALTKTYTLDPGFPVAINNMRSETLVIDRDTTGRLWATWIQSQKVYVNRTTGSDTTWGTPFVLPVAGTSVAADDISSVIAFGPGRIGVMWSNQATSAMYFATHVDGDPDTTWEPSRTAIQGPNNADDHINLKSLQSDGGARVFAAVKTSLTSANAPLIMLLVRDPANGNWTSYPVGRVSDHQTRPIVLLDTTNRIIHIFLTAPEAGGAIYEKTSPLDAISFAQGPGTPVMVDASNPGLNNATSTKQAVDSSSGLVVLAANDQTMRYWHHYDPLNGSPSPTPSPSVSPSAPPPPTPSPTSPPSPTPSPTPTPTATPSPTPTPTPRPSPSAGGQLTFTATADAQVLSSSPTTNYGTRTNITVRNGGSTSYSYRSYLTFAVTGLAGPPRSAVLRIFVTDPSTNGGAAYATSRSWTETGITWSNAPPPSGPALAQAGATTTGTWVQLNVTAAVTGNGTVSLALSDGNGDSAIYSSREGTNPPQLVVTP